MILVDTSVWVDHLRQGDAALAGLLNAGRVLAHAFVTGELALGSLGQRAVVLGALEALPQAPLATHLEIMRFIDTHALYNLGVGYVDAHLLAATRLTPGASLWTRDKRLAAVATRLNLATTEVV